jgi:hypothetical protein
MEEIALWKDSKWLVLSSSFLCIPGLYAYCHNLNFISGMIIISSIISANHWRKPLWNCWRRKIDLGVSNIACSVIFVNNVMYVTIYYQCITYSLFFMLLYCFYQSHFLYKYNTTIWRNYHFLFHLLCTCNAGIVIYNRITFKS